MLCERCKDEITLVNGLKRSYKEQFERGDQKCVCGAEGTVLYHNLGGWWCKEHEYIPEREFSKNQKPLMQAVAEQIENS